MLTNEQRCKQIKSHIKKEFDQKNWVEDIHRYERYNKIVRDLEERNIDASGWRKRIVEIKEKYPNIKDWP